MRAIQPLGLGLRVLTALAVVTLVGSIDEESLECEEAIARLRDCCTMRATLNVCATGCDSVKLSLEESECIQRQSCDELRAGLVCERVQALADEASTIEEPNSWAEVCP